jgi:small-conductance mechanosensitive channel
VHAEDVESVGLVPGVDYAQVVLDGRELFHVRGVSIYKASMRADIISKRIKSLAADPTFTTNLISVVSTNGEEIIMAGDTMIVALVEKDAELIGLDRELAARLVKIKIEEAITRYRQERMPGEILSRAIRAVVITVLLLVVLSILRKVHRSISEFVQSRIVARLEKSVQIQSFEVVQRQHLWMVYRALMDIIRIGVAAVIIYLYLQHVLQLFPWTRGAGLTLLAMLVSPLHVLWSGLVGMIPDLIFLAILFLIVRYILRVIYLFFLNLEKGDVRLMGFESEWAQPTFRLVRFMIILLAIVVAYPYIPGSDSNAFKGISVFMGVVLSLGSSSLVSNIMAGYIMTYRKGFRVGDRIKIGDHLGDVLDIRMLVTRMRSPKNEEIIVPNTEILTKEVVNYSALANTRGLILHTTVGIGYETPWRQVEAMLLEAAGKTPGVLKDREPYVLQKALGDFAVTYEINVYCDDAQRSYLIYTDLHRNILDVFNQYGVQIMTPNYEGDPEQPKIVAADQWFAAPAKPSPDSKET